MEIFSGELTGTGPGLNRALDKLMTGMKVGEINYITPFILHKQNVAINNFNNR